MQISVILTTGTSLRLLRHTHGDGAVDGRAGHLPAIFPLTLRFLGTYQVTGEVANMITLRSYMGTLVMTCLCLGVVFEMPVVIWLLSKMGLVSAPMLKRYRRHAIVVLLIVAAVITPTSDVFTLLPVAPCTCSTN